MTVNEIITKNNISKYRLAKNSDIPYMTINDICNGKTNLAECSAKTIYKIAKTLGVSMEELIEPYMQPRISFDLFKSNVCHRVKELGDIDFLAQTIESRDILFYYERRWYPECLYLLAMVDYLSRENNIPLCKEFSEIRRMKLNEMIYPASVLSAYEVSKDESVKEQAMVLSIPEFRRFNIIESEIRNVV